jgi:hypothetical protein
VTIAERLDELEEELRATPAPLLTTDSRLALLEEGTLRLLQIVREVLAGDGDEPELGVLEGNHRRFMAEIRDRQARRRGGDE